MTFKIEKGINPPAERKSRYPFAEMAVGDSFSFSASERAKIQNAASAYSRSKGKGTRFRVRTEGTSGRVWRIK